MKNLVCLLLTAVLAAGDAFAPPRLARQAVPHLLATAAGVVEQVPTKPIEGMKPGTSGLRKKVEVWQAKDPSNQHYLENFIQSLLDTAFDGNGGKPLDAIIVAGDGRYFNAEAMQVICRILAANGVANIYVPQGGIMSTPAVSACIRRKDGGKPQGGIVLTASHNPGGPDGGDFGIKYNEAFGQPAGEEFTDAVSLVEKSGTCFRFYCLTCLRLIICSSGEGVSKSTASRLSQTLQTLI
jgi:hypothetical protein